MDQRQRREYLIRRLLAEQPQHGTDLPQGDEEQRYLLRGLMNVRMPAPIGGDFLRVQDAYLQEEIQRMGVTDYKTLTAVEPGIYLWQGDITTLKCDAIVNAANAGMTGCYQPNHKCIDNCIHTFGGVQMRLECARLMEAQGHAEPTGRAKITRGYNLPSRYVLHTVGPIIRGPVTDEDRALLASCYRACLALAEENGLSSVAFCGISTGVFRFPKDEAAQIAVKTVRAWRARSDVEVIFNVHNEDDLRLYKSLLG